MKLYVRLTQDYWKSKKKNFRVTTQNKGNERHHVNALRFSNNLEHSYVEECHDTQSSRLLIK